MPIEADIAIIGAGAAGLAAAIFAAQANPALNIIILDGAKTIGAKILVSGGARCNVTHHHVTPADFNAPTTFVRHVLAAFDHHQTVQWFASLGVNLKREETGKLFPVTDSSKTILNALINRCAQLKIDLRTSHRVTQIETVDAGFIVTCASPQASSPTTQAAAPQASSPKPQARFTARKLILATGGKSLPLTGSDGQGWVMVQSLGHTVTPTYPALVPLILHADFFHSQISGLSLEVELSTFAGTSAKRIDHRTGSLLWTHFGISGPVVMDASRHWVIAQATGQNPSLLCSLLPGRDFASVENLFLQQAARNPRRSIAAAIDDLLPGKLVEALLDHVRISPRLPLAQMARQERRTLVHALTALPLPVTRDRGWNYAEVTAGGVPLSEVHHRDMQSRLVKGLYLIGEMLDCDGRIGGFNFQWAWSTGYLAGQAAAKGKA